MVCGLSVESHFRTRVRWFRVGAYLSALTVASDRTVQQRFGFWVDNPGEPPITNSTFLGSYVRYAAWLRFVAAREQLELLKGPEVESMRRLAAIADFYQQIGMQLEDLACTVIAWMALAANRDLLLADVLNAIILTKERKAREGYCQECINALASGLAPVRIDPSIFFSQLRELGGRRCLELMGLPWSQVPAAKLAKGDELIFWSKLPKGIETVTSLFAHSAATALTKTFNKIKHGPQLVVVDLPGFFGSAGLPEQDVQAMREELRQKNLRPETIRVLFSGAKVSSTGDNRQHSWMFLEDDVSDMEALLYGVLYAPTKSVWLVANFLWKRWYGGFWVQPHPVLIEIDKCVGRVQGRG